ncbi:MAG: hypothetical protein RLZZ505_392 [Verrucomicrobiota bacterium]|jgi:hypothetical protein
MTEPESSKSDEFLNADVLGRVRVRPEHRERMLDAFEDGAMSGQAFAIRHGIKVQTFASWMQKRRRLRMPAKSNARSTHTPPLEVVFTGGAFVRIGSESQIGLLKTLLRELPFWASPHRPRCGSAWRDVSVTP